MKVRLIKDYDIESWLFQGTILHECILADSSYIGLFTSKIGNFVVNVPENYCELIDDENIEE
jgi:hypothetical protein